MNDIKNLVVIGTSAGGLKALGELAAVLPKHMPAAILIVMHMSKASSAETVSLLLGKHTNYTCLVPADGEIIKNGYIYLAPPDLQMLVKGGRIRLTNGPHENRWRPAVDVLFRSAAVAYNSKVTGIILTGMLDDGTSGMLAIKRCGGTCIVQEPVEAEYPEMPVSVLRNVDVDHRVNIADMGYILDDVFSKPAPEPAPVPEDIRIEAQITERMASSLTDMAKIGTHSNYTCPDCGGGLWKMENETAPRYRCHTGHVYTEKLLFEKQGEELEESLWVSIRMLEERRNLQLNMAARQDKLSGNQDSLLQRAEELAVHIERMKSLLTALHHKETSDEGYL